MPRFASILRLSPSILLRISLLAVLVTGLVLQPQSTVYAAAQLTITPLTWNVIGLDSNNVSVGPNNFPVGARVCNTGDETANDVSSAFHWESVDPTPAKDYINLRPGSNASYSGYTLAPSQCVDFYYEIQVTRNANAYNDTRRYYITATANTLGTISTPRPREIFVEYLISQNRNAVTDVMLNGVSTPAGGTMELFVGNTYDIQLVGKTATQGYEQLESFINFPNTIFQVNSVTSTYSANAGTDGLAATKPYADGCGWVNDPGSPNYRSCTATGKYGGNVTVNYNVTIIGGAGTNLTLNTLIYDFSGSSYHYNADFSTGARFASILGPSSVTITKTFTPKAISPGGTSVMTFKLTNPTAETISGVNFTDTLQGGLKVAATPNVSYSGCGAGAFSPAPVADATSLSFSNGTIAPNGTCTINVSVTADTAADYPNTTGNLFINTSVDTGNTGSDTLKVSSAAACQPGQILAVWAFTGLSNTPANALNPPVTTQAGNVTTAAASTNTSSPAIETNTSYGNPAPSWSGQGFTGGAYFQFQVDTSKYTGVTISFNHIQTTASWNVSTVTVSSSADGITFTSNGSATLSASMGSSTFNTSAGSTYFRISATGAQNSNSRFAIDNITFTGCLVPAPAPTLTKSFSPDPIVKGGTSTLTFTITNTASGNVAQSGISFTDVLPAGLSVADGVFDACNGANNLVTTASTRTISLTGGSLSAGGSCTFSVPVTGVEEGNYENISGFLSSNQSGTSTSYATDTLTVIAPPELEKSFSPTSILVGETSVLRFTITNPNPSTTLTGIGFTDTLPAGVTAANGSFNYCNGTLDITGGSLLTFSGGSVNANSACSFTVTVTGATVGIKNNTTSAATSTQAGNGNSASATLTVSDPQPLIGLSKQISLDNTTWAKYVGLIPTDEVFYRFTITNDGETTLEDISVTDPNVDMGTCAPALPVSLAVGDSASCVVGPITVSSIPSPNPFVNTAVATTTTYSPGPEGTSSAQYGTKSLTLDKTADKTTFSSEGEIVTYSYLVTNDGGFPLLGPVAVTDDKATVVCPEVNTVGDLDNHLDPGESLTCTASYSVTAADITAGRLTNTASASLDGVTSNADSVTITLPPDLTVSKTNDVSGGLALGNSFNWTITITNNGIAAASFADADVILSDALPGADGYYPQGALTVTPGSTPPAGTINCSITGSALSCAANGAVTLPEGASFSVTFLVTPASAGSLVNTATVDPNNVISESSEANNSSSDTVTVAAPPSIAKSFAPNPIPVGGTSTLTFTITNANASTSLTGVGFTDTLPAGLEVDSAPNASVSAECGSPAFAPTAGDTSLTFSGGTIPASGTCTVTVNVTATTSGTKLNTTGNVASSNAGTGNTASAALGVSSLEKTIVSTSESSTGFVSGFERVAIGEAIRYRLTTELPEGTWTNVEITDTIDAGLLFLNDGTASVSYVCDGSCTNSSFTITPATFASGTDPVFILGTVTNPDNDADAEYMIVEFNALMLNLASNNSGGFTRNNSYTISFNGASLTSPSVGVRVAEPAITNLTKTVSPVAGPYHPGDLITYTLIYSNSATGVGRATAFDVFLTDALSGDLDLQSVSVTAPGVSTATDTSTLGVGGVVRILIDQLPPAVDISSGPTGVTVTVTAQIVNTASGGTLSNTANVTYTGLPGGVTTGDANGTCPNGTGSCTPGASGSLTGERNGTGGSPNVYADTAAMDIAVTPSADLSVTKTDSVTTYSPGGTVTYTITVTNNGPSNVTGASFNDAIPSQITEWTWTCAPDTGAACTAGPVTSSSDFSDTIDLPAGGSVVYTVTATIGSSAVGDLVNTATVTVPGGVTDPALGNNSSTDTNTFVGIPALTVAKTETSTGPYAVGNVITYNVVATNTGSAVLTNVVVSDPQLTPNSETCSSLSPGETCILSGSHMVTQAEVDAGSLVNTASVTDDAFCPAAGAATCEDSVTVNFTQTPGIAIDKSSNATGANAVGDTITYTYDVVNTGNVTLTNVTVTDAHAGLSVIACTPAQGSSLAPGDVMQCTATYTVTQADVDAGQIDNTGVAAGAPPTGPDVTDDASLSEPVAQNPGVNIAKTPATQSVLSGGTANFTLTVTNTGNVTLTGVVVTDAQCTTGPAFTGGDTNGDSQLQISETWTYSCSVDNVTANFTNTASVNTAQGATDSDSADVTVTVLQADLSLDKSVSNAAPLVTTNIDFTLSVTNSGPDAATNVQVTDVLPGGFSYVTHSASQGVYASGTDVWNVGTLLLNQTETLTITVTVNVTGPYTNYAEITASDVLDPDSTPDNASTNEDDDDSVTVTPTQNDPSGLTKTVSGSNQAFTAHPNVAIGEIVTYQVSVEVPPGVFDNARLVDTMQRGLAYMDCVSIDGAGLTTSAAGGFTQACSTPTVDDAGGGTTVDVGRRVTFDFATLTNNTASDQTLVITYRAVVLDSAGNVSGVSLSNSATWMWSGAGSLGPAGTTVNILEPDLSISKTANASLVSVGSEFTITLRIQHTAQSETNAYDAVVTDVLPAELEYVTGTLECVSGAQDANVCNYDSATRTISAVWDAFLFGGGNGQVTFRVRVVSLPSSGITNVASVAWTSLPGDVSAPQTPDPVNVFSTERAYDPGSPVDVYGASATLTLNVFGTSQGALLPATGFAPNAITDLGNLPSENYSQTGGLALEIPSLEVNLPIVGVPLRNGAWNVSWLGNQAGWLEGSAFPSWSGNSVLTSHVYLSNGLPGPFVNLNRLMYGERIVVHAYGQKFIYEVRTNSVVLPNDASLLRHEEKAWLTLVTCMEFDEKTNSYKKRVVVRAVLVSVER